MGNLCTKLPKVDEEATNPLSSPPVLNPTSDELQENATTRRESLRLALEKENQRIQEEEADLKLFAAQKEEEERLGDK